LASYADSKGNSEQFLYSNDGLKKKRVNGSTTTIFAYDEAALLLETDASNKLKARYTNSPETWGGLASQSRSGVSSFYGCDSQLSCRMLVSSAGVITDSYSWKAFGEPIQTGSGTDNPYGYVAQGLYYTEFADLINAWNRWLKASIGRWESRDPLGFRCGDWNSYRYVSNRAVSSLDPTGLQGGKLPPNSRGCTVDFSDPGKNRITDPGLYNNVQTGLSDLYGAIGNARMDSGFTNAVNQCVASALDGTGTDCSGSLPANDSSGYSCLQQFCNGDNGSNVACDGPDCKTHPGWGG
jgi:RHS repeat-associated protein